ncbi:hypothetical protein Q7P37_004231 [Cladosporium fusiforme]
MRSDPCQHAGVGTNVDSFQTLQNEFLVQIAQEVLDHEVIDLIPQKHQSLRPGQVLDREGEAGPSEGLTAQMLRLKDREPKVTSTQRKACHNGLVRSSLNKATTSRPQLKSLMAHTQRSHQTKKSHRLSPTLSNNNRSFVNTTVFNMVNSGMKRSDSVRTVHQHLATMATATRTSASTAATKRPYWAGPESSTESLTTGPAISNPPVPASTVPDSGRTYEFVSNPYAAAEPGTPPYTVAVGANSPHASRAKEVSWTHQGTQEATAPAERAISPGSIFPSQQTRTTSATDSSRSSAVKKSLASKFGSVRRAASTAKKSLAQKVRTSDEVKISGPVPGSFHREGNMHVLAPQDGIPPLNLVGLETAQANVQRYGQADHDLAAVSAAAVAMRASAIAAAERAAFSPESPTPGSPVPSTASSVYSIPRRPIPASPLAAPSPPAQAVRTQAPLVPPRSLRRVTGTVNRDTMWGDFTGTDEFWVRRSQFQVQGEMYPQQTGKGKGKASEPAPVSTSRDNATTSAPTDSVLAPSPSVNRQPSPDDSYSTTHRHSPDGPSNAPLATTLASQGLRRASYVPGIRCSDCGQEIDVDAVASHNCSASAPSGPRRTATSTQAPDRPGNGSGAHEEAARFMSMIERPAPAPEPEVDDEEPEVIVDMFIEEGHTRWRGSTRSPGGTVACSHQGDIRGGLQGQKAHEGEDAEEAGAYRRLLGIG